MATFDELWGKSTPNSWARVPRGPVATWVGATLFGGILTGTVAGVATATIAGFLITTAVASWAMSALMPKPKMEDRGLQQNIRDAAAPFDIVYGEVRKGGVITFMEASGKDNKYLHYIIVLAGHEVESIGDIYINDKVVNWNPTTNFVNESDDTWGTESIRIRKHLGGPDQTVDPYLLLETSVTSDFRGRGIAYLYVRLRYNKEVFADGTPTITAVVKGKKVFDPRSNTTKWTDNAALCIRDYVRSEYGLNAQESPTTLNSPSWATMANVCDTIVPLKSGGSEKRYTLNGVLSTATSPRENLQKMFTTCGGTLYWGQGQWQFKVGYLPAGPYVNFTDSDFRSGIELVTKNSRKENFNSVIGVFNDKAQDWIQADYPKVKSSVFLARDNGQENPLDMTLPLTTSSSAAQRIAKMAMFRSREEMIISAEFSLKAVQVAVGDVVSLTFNRYGFTNKLFEVLSWKIIPEADELKVGLVLKETSAAAYDWNAEENDVLKNNTNLPNGRNNLNVTNLTVTNRNTLQKDGTLLGEVVLSWNAALNAFVDYYEVQWKRSDTTQWSSTTTNEVEIVLNSVQYGQPHNFRVRAVTVGGFAGPWEQISATLSGKTTPPSVPGGVTATGIMKAIEVKWNKPSDPDFNHVEIFSNSTNNSGTATLLAKSSGTNYIDNLDPMTTRWYFLRSVDHSGNKSAFSTGKSATALFVNNSDVDIDVKKLINDAGLAPVEISATLPTTGNTVGRTIYRTTDKQLWIWNGTAWEKAVDADLAGKLLGPDNFPSGLKPIEIVSTLPTTGNYQGRTVFLLSDNKLYRHTGSPAGAAGFTSAIPSSDLSGQITSVQIGDNAISSPKLAAGAVSTDKLEANAVTTGKLAAGAVTADILAANSVVASKLAITDITNYVPDADFNDIIAWILGSEWNFVVNNDGTFGKSNRLRFTSTSSSTGYSGVARSKAFSVEPNTEYFVEYKFRSNTTISSLLGRIHYFDKDGNELPYKVINDNGSTNTSPTIVKNSFIPPVGTVVADLRWYVQRTGSGSGWLEIVEPSVRRKNGGELLVDGAVKANHMSANSVTAGVIAAGAINASNLFVDNVITAAKLNVNDLSAISANLGTIKVDSANIADGAISSAKIANSIQSTNFVTGEGGQGWRIQKNGVAEFNKVIIRRQLEVASGTIDVGSFTPRTAQYGNTNPGETFGYDTLTGSSVNLENGPGKVVEVLTTPVAMTAWQGADKTYIATVGMVGGVNTSLSAECYWGWDAQVLPLTKWSGNQSLRLRLTFWSKNVNNVNNCILTWKIYEVS